VYEIKLYIGLLVILFCSFFLSHKIADHTTQTPQMKIHQIGSLTDHKLIKFCKTDSEINYGLETKSGFIVIKESLFSLKTSPVAFCLYFWSGTTEIIE
jgi:hypothetical protein